MMALVIFMALGLNACEDKFVETAYKTLNTMAVFYDSTMTAAGDLYSQGKLGDTPEANEATKQKIVAAGKIYKASHAVAVDALAAYKRSEMMPGMKIKAVLALTALLEQYDDFVALATSVKQLHQNRQVDPAISEASRKTLAVH